METNPTRNHEVVSWIPDLAQWVRDLVLLWLWYRPVATAPIRPLAWESPYAAEAAQEIAKEKKRERKPVQKFPLWHNMINGVSAMPGHRFDPQPGTVG